MEFQEQKYRLEYSEQQQSFHMAFFEDPKNTNGYVTVIPSCTEMEKDTLKAYLLKNKSNSMSISPEHRITLKDV